LENRLTGLEHLRDETARKIGHLRDEMVKARDLLDKPFPHAEQLAGARARVDELSEKLKALANGSANEERTRPKVEAPAGGPRTGNGSEPAGEARSDSRERRQQWAQDAAVATQQTVAPPTAARLPVVRTP
jgi:hypothetical protein